MGQETLVGDARLSKLRVALVLLGDAMLFVAFFLIAEIDKLINQILYSYGLQFSLDWAQPYWIMMRVSMVVIVAAILLISVVELPVPAFQEHVEKSEKPMKSEQDIITKAEIVEEAEAEEQPEAIIEPEVEDT